MEFITIASSASRNQKSGQASLDPLPHPANEDVGVGEFHTEGIGELSALEVVS
jgi:hypothetical protein